MQRNIIKRILVCFIVAMLVVGCTPVLSVKSEETKYNGVESIKLDKEEINLYVGEMAAISYNYYYRSNFNNDFKFTWSSSNKKVATVSDGIITAIESGKADITIKSGTAIAKCKVTVTLSENQKKVNKIINNMKKVDKIKTIHDYIITTTKYDNDNYMSDTIPDISYTAAGVLLNGTAVCQGYAEAFQLFMDKLKIPCKTVNGKANGDFHAWNIVKIGDDWYWIDVTWDDKVPDEGRISYEYFLISDKELKKTHDWETKDTAKGTKYKYYGYKDCTIDNINDIKNIVEKQKSLNYLTIVCPKSIKDKTLETAAKLFYEAKGLEYFRTAYSKFNVGNKIGYQIWIK